MAHCPPEKLSDLSELLQQIRNLPGLKEKQTGIFYYKGKGFLHFHSKDHRRWADVRDGADWGEPIDLDWHPNTETQAAFLAEVIRRLAGLVNPAQNPKTHI